MNKKEEYCTVRVLYAERCVLLYACIIKGFIIIFMYFYYQKNALAFYSFFFIYNIQYYIKIVYQR